MMEYIKLKRHYIIALAIMFVVVSLSGTTYSLFLNVEETPEFNYSTGSLDLQFIEDEQIYIKNALPIIDSDGLETEPYDLTIKNTGTLPYQFDLKMLSSTADNLIDMKYIKYQVNNQDPNTLYASNNIIASNIMLYPEEEITFKVKIWLDINTPNNQLGKTFMAKLAISGQSAYRTLDTSGANRPTLIDNMLPVYYDSGTNSWKKADETNMLEQHSWYNYDNKQWANVVTINSSERKIYDITGNQDIVIKETRTNNGNYVSDKEYLDLKLLNYGYANISSIYRIKFNNLSEENIYIMSNDIFSYYYDTVNSNFVFELGENKVTSKTYAVEKKSWHILGFTHDGNQVKFYIDGTNISTETINGRLTSNTSFKIGTDRTFKKVTNIEVGDIYIYYSILSSEEINDNYKTNINIIYNNLFVGYNDFRPKTLNEYYETNPVGTPIRNEDVSSYYVWIPRFKYKLWNVIGIPGMDSYNAYEKGIDIIFEKDTESSGVITCENNICYNDPLKITKVTNADNDKYYTHPAFTVGEKEVNGIWVSKYEISTSNETCTSEDTSGCLSNNLKVESKPGNTAWRNNYLSYFYQNIKNLNPNEKNYSVIKNTEWGAISYLTHSKYGLCQNGTCTSIGVNKTYVSGNNIKDSTTNNMSGVFDLGGSATEFVMANYTNNPNNLTLNGTHFEDTIIEPFDYNLYQENTFILGDATKEISLEEGIWNNNYNSFINETNNWLIRGGIGPTDYNGIFYYNATTDTESEYITTRIIVK